MELITVKEYAKREKITETTARKRVSDKYCKSIKLDTVLYVVVEDTKSEKIKNLRKRLGTANGKIRELKLIIKPMEDKAEEIKLLRDRITELQEKLEDLHKEHKADLRDTIVQQGTVLIGQAHGGRQ